MEVPEPGGDEGGDRERPGSRPLPAPEPPTTSESQIPRVVLQNDGVRRLIVVWPIDSGAQSRARS